MGGMMMTAAGAGMVVLAVVLFAASIIYRKTEGRKIREALWKDYEQSL